MVYLKHFSPSILSLYIIHFWFVPSVLSQADTSDDDDDNDDDDTGDNENFSDSSDNTAPGPATPIATVDSSTIENLPPTPTSTVDNNPPLESTTNAPIPTTDASIPTTDASIPTTDASISTTDVENIPTSSQIISSSTTTSTLPTISSVSNSNGNPGAIAGGVIGGILGLAIIGAAAFWFLRKKRKSDQEVFRPDSEADDYSNSSRPINLMAEYSACPPPLPPSHSYYDPSNRPIVY